MTTLDVTSSCQDIHAWLATLSLPGWYIHPKLFSFTDHLRKRNELKRIDRAKIPDDHKEALHSDFQLPDTLGTLLPKIRNSGTLVLMSGPLYSASDLNGNPSAFHTFVFLYKYNTAIVVDPAYGPPDEDGGEGNSNGLTSKMRFSAMGGGLGLAISLLRKMKGKHSVLKYWLGKGSEMEYDDLNCNTLAQDFVKTFVDGGGNIYIDWDEEGFEEMVT